ncbi:MAG: phosphate ABC transporter permease subunit PstC, partial [Sphingomonadales bacterium]|nr:phosphate ABC transporter permease subunit PstC [Sphingomonadales bacterium]
MTPLALLFVIVGLGLIGWLTARTRALAQAATSPVRPNSLPSQHGFYVALWTVLPALGFVLLWSALSPSLVTASALADPAAQALPAAGYERDMILNEARSLASGSAYGAFFTQSEALAPAFAAAMAKFRWIGAVVALLLAFAGGAFAYSRVSPSLRARTRVERGVMLILLVASLIAILTTLGI